MKNFKRAGLMIMCYLFLVIGCASRRDIHDCQKRLQRQESEQTKANEEIKKIITTTEQINQTLGELKFDINIMRKELLLLSEHAEIEPVVGSQTAVGALIKDLSSERYNLDQIVSRAIKLGKSSFVALVSLLRNPDFKIRARAETVLNKLPPIEINPILSEAIKNPEIRVSIVRIIGNLDSYGGLAILVDYLDKEGSAELDFVLAEALVKLRDKRGIPRIIDYLKNEDAVRRAIAFDCLTKASGFTFDYKPYASEFERKKAVKLWEGWWLKNGMVFEFQE